MTIVQIENTPVDIHFEDLSYLVSNGKSGTKKIIKSHNGTFYSGNLTGILGSSGAGKTTLLNILAGYVNQGVLGKIYINNQSRELKTFKKISTFIMQEDLLQPFLTVKEYMMCAINLKMSPNLSESCKESIVISVAETLGLSRCLNTRSEHLSGGQRKRLSIAVELVNDPPIIFLDEPTTGLDDVTAKQCMQLLKSLAQKGKTVICTIHQPSDSLFKLFDQVYFMDSGYCIYNNNVQSLVPFLSSSGFDCPKTYNPADYIIELTQSDPNNVLLLSKQAKSFQYHQKRKIQELPNGLQTGNNRTFRNDRVNFCRQVLILLQRSYLQIFRNKSSLSLMLFHHVLSGVLIGSIFFGIGKNASMVYENFKFGMTVIIYVVYSNAIVPTLTYPLEVKLIKREYFNGWYSLKAYFLALVLAPLVFMFIAVNIFILICYSMTDQPMELNRYILFTIPVILLGMNSNTFGVAIGAMFNPKNGAAITPSTLAPLVILGVYGMGFGRFVHPFMKAVIHVSFFRYGIVAFCSTIFENRHDLVCPEIYCHYKDTELFLKDMGMHGTSYSLQIIALLAFLTLHVCFGYFFLKLKFSSDFMEHVKRIRLKIFSV
nr:ATP-binding cassette sub-family G member 4-like [Onthophagus taurus]